MVDEQVGEPRGDGRFYQHVVSCGTQQQRQLLGILPRVQDRGLHPVNLLRAEFVGAGRRGIVLIHTFPSRLPALSIPIARNIDDGCRMLPSAGQAQAAGPSWNRRTAAILGRIGGSRSGRGRTLEFAWITMVVSDFPVKDS